MTTCIMFILFCFAAIGAAFYSAEEPLRRMSESKQPTPKAQPASLPVQSESYDTSWFKEYTKSCAKF